MTSRVPLNWISPPQDMGVGRKANRELAVPTREATVEGFNAAATTTTLTN